MKCYACGGELIWGADHDIPDDAEDQEFEIVTNLSCPDCKAVVLVYHQKDSVQCKKTGYS